MRVSSIELTVKMLGVECTRSMDVPSQPDLTPDDIAFLRSQIASDLERLIKEDIMKDIEERVIGV